MEKNYFTYPKKVMNISQTYLGTYSHYPHITGIPKDYPIDDSGASSHDAIFCNCDELEVVRISGIGQSDVTNTIWLCSTTPVVTPTFTDYAFIIYTHPNDEDLKEIKVGQKFKRGDVITYEGTDGMVTGAHVHIVVGRGKSSGWTKNTNGKWVIVGDTKKPEEVLFIDPDFTEIKNNRGLIFKNLPKSYLGSPVIRDKTKNQLEVKVEQLRARKTPNGEILGYIHLGIYNILSQQMNGDYTWYQVEEDKWIAYKEEWITLYLKEETNELEQLKKENENLKKQLESLKEPIFSFTCTKDNQYSIYLREKETLKIFTDL